MGAIDPLVNSRGRSKIKSASIEAGSNQALIGRSQTQFYHFGGDDHTVAIPDSPTNKSESPQNGTHHRNNNNNNNTNNNSFHSKAKKLLTFSPSATSLKPSISTSCLITTEDSQDKSNSLVCVPTRASLTHQWKKLKTPNKCRECNLLVYFNGRECSFCGFVAHKKCVTVLVIKCSGQQVTELNKLNKINQQDKGANQQRVSTGDCGTSYSTNQQSAPRKVKAVPIQPIFGQPIGLDSFKVIDFIRRFIYEIDTRGLTSRGIYRVSSIKSKVDRLCNYYDQNLSSLIDLSSFHPNIIANALKMYLRQLPEPLLTHQLYQNFIDVAKKYSSSPSPSSPSSHHSQSHSVSSSSRLPNKLSLLQCSRQRKAHLLPITATITTDPSYNPMLIVDLREVIDSLPPINKDLIAIIMRHLKRVADMSADNQMSAKNLSIIFGPTLLTANNKSLAIVDNIHQARVVELMITWADQIFPQYANYESKAVIELNYSQEQIEPIDDPNRLESQEAQSRLSEMPEQHKQDRLSDNTQKKTGNKGQTKCKDKQKTKSDKHNLQNIQRDIMSHDLDKTRNDIKELRRQFFTVPQVKTDLVTTNLSSSQVLSVPLKTQESIKELPKGALNSFHTPGSVPVIKVQPFYCNMLTKYSKGERL